MRRLAAAGLLALTLDAAPPAVAQPLGLAWGVVAEPAAEGAATPQTVNEHLEFLLAHGWQPLRLADLDGGEGTAEGTAKRVLVTFDDPASAARYVLPLLELYRLPAVVTVSAAEGDDPALAAALGALARSPWVEIVPRIERVATSAESALRCGPPVGTPSADRGAGAAEGALRASLARQVARLRGLGGHAPTAVAWGPGAWDGAAETVANSLGLAIQLPTFDGVPPHLDGSRLGRTAIAPWAGVWAVAQAGARWDPDRHLVRFLEVDPAWVCNGGDPQARLARIVAVVRRLALNGVRMVTGDGAGAWFPATTVPVRGDVVGPVAGALRAAGVAWVAVDLPSTGDADRDVALARELAAAVDLDVAILPSGAGHGDRLATAVRAGRPAIRLAWRDESRPGDRAFRLAPPAPEGTPACGATVGDSSVALADRAATDLAIAGCEWIGLDVELAELGLRDSLRSLAAFALPGAGKASTP